LPLRAPAGGGSASTLTRVTLDRSKGDATLADIASSGS